jgi:predicted Fe-S protein YdhL (DUF1289 family)
MPPAADAPIESPCVRICMVDGKSGLCLGCFRTLAEIARWTGYSDDERAAIMHGLAARRDRIRPEVLERFGR